MNKLMRHSEVADAIPAGSTIAIGGSSLSRKPMSLVRALAARGAGDLRLIVDVGGPEVDLLLGMGKVSKVVYAFVGFEIMGLAPHFRRAREQGSVTFEEWTEFTVMAGLDATVKNVPFLPTHAGLGTDVLAVNHSFKLFEDPIEGQTLVAVPALKPDFALVHVNLADPLGNGVILGDGHVDVLCAKAARYTILSAERIVSPEELQRYGRDVQIHRIHVDGVVEAAWGAHFTGCAPYYRADLGHVQEYLTAARSPETWEAYCARYITDSPPDYIGALGGPEELVGKLEV
ncbi:MAG: CoA transferase subunit A [Clostridia bacterium]